MSSNKKKTITVNTGKPKVQRKKKEQKTQASPPISQAKIHEYMAKTNAVSKVCGITDPFCSHARGAKYPDGSPVRTLPYSWRYRSSITTAAGGESMQFFAPQYNYLPMTAAATATGSNVTAWNNFGALGLISNVSQYRIVSAGVIIKRMCAPLYASGMVRIRSWPTEHAGTYGAIDVASYNSTFALDVPLADCHEVALVFQHSSQMPQLFYAPGNDHNAPNTLTSKGFQPITVFVEGAPASSAVLDVQFYINYELAFTDGDGLSQLATPPPLGGTAIAQAAARITSLMPAAVVGGVGKIGKYVVDKAVVALGTYMVGPTAAASLAVPLLVD